MRSLALPLAMIPLVFAGCSGGAAKNSGSMIPPVSSGSRSPMSISQVHTYTAAPTTVNYYVQVALSPSPAPGDTEVAVVYGFNTADQCYSLQVPTGWALYDSSCVGNNRNTVWTLTHVAGSGETSYKFQLSDTTKADYFSVVVYDLSGVGANPIDSNAHADLTFSSGTQQKTALVTPTQNGDLAIATFATAYVKDPTIVSPWTSDGNADGGIYLTSAHLALSSMASTQATANYSSSPSSGESNILLIAPAIPPIIENQPLLRVVSEVAIPSGTGLLYYGQVAPQSSACTGRSIGAGYGCQSYPNYSIAQDFCDYTNDLAEHANSSGIEADFLHTSSPISSSNRLSATSADSKCGNYFGAANAYYYMNLAASDSATWLANNVLNPTNIPSNGAFFDGNDLWYGGAALTNVEFGSSDTSCAPYPSCKHQWISGGLDNTSYDAAIGQAISALSSTFHILLNNLMLPQGGNACSALTSQAPFHCVGDQYNNGSYDSRVRLDELCNAITGKTNLDMVRGENSQNASASATINPVLGQENAVLLNTIYDLQYSMSGSGCKYTMLLLQESYPTNGARWSEDAITAMQWMAPSADGTPDEIAQEPYTYCVTFISCGSTKDYGIYPDAFVVPSGPAFSTSAYNIGAYASPHDATDCPGSGAPIQVQSDSGGSTSMVVYCQSASYPVFAASYHHCYFVQYDLGECIALFNTGTSSVSLSSITKVNLSAYHYQLAYNGDEWGSSSSMGGSTTVAGMFPWLSTSSSLYSALSAEFSACNYSTYCNGSASFATVPASIGANSAMFLVANKPSNY